MINNAKDMDGVLKTEVDRRKVARRKKGQLIDSRGGVNTTTGKLSSLNIAGMSRRQRRIARVEARQRAAKPSKKSKKKKLRGRYNMLRKSSGAVDDGENESGERELTEAEKLIQASKMRANIYRAERAAAGINPVKKIKASFRAFFRRKLDESGTISKGLQNLLGDDYAADLKGIERRPTCHYLPGITKLTVGKKNN